MGTSRRMRPHGDQRLRTRRVRSGVWEHQAECDCGDLSGWTSYREAERILQAHRDKLRSEIPRGGFCRLPAIHASMPWQYCQWCAEWYKMGRLPL